MADSPLAAPASASASAPAWAAQQSLPLRHDEPTGFPVAGALLLVVLLAFALALKWRASRGGLPTGAGWWSRFPGRSTSEPALRIIDSVQAAPGVRLIVVEWAGGRLMIGANGTSELVVLDRAPARPPEPVVP